MLKKIVIIGPESTGKSYLCKALATHYKTLWCVEYAREYLLKNGKDYTYNDLLKIAKGQIELEENTILSAKQIKKQTDKPIPIFIDTDMYVMKVWCEFVFDKCHAFILEQIKKRKYDLYLLCNTDLPWEKDALREYPDLKTREDLFKIYFKILQQQKTPFEIISGKEEKRTKKAIEAVNKILLQ